MFVGAARGSMGHCHCTLSRNGNGNADRLCNLIQFDLIVMKRLQNDLFCVEWDIKPYLPTHWLVMKKQQCPNYRAQSYLTRGSDCWTMQ